uniref:Integral membrane protein n=1 Tax=Streptomyces sp. NBC_00003 TaxID=2903608 RepID=A0AAU2V484_9ACTN
MTDLPSAPATGTAWGARSKDALASAPAQSGAGRTATGRRGPADPVKALMHRHRELCERAVDPLEIAAGLEAHGVTDRTAARFRHRDVFSLAEELYARVPRDTETPLPVRELTAQPVGWALWALLPGIVSVLAVEGVQLAEGGIRSAVGAVGAVAFVVALTLTLRRGPLRAGPRNRPAARLCAAWLMAYAIGGDGLLAEAVRGGPDGGWPLDPAAATGLAFAVAPAMWCAHLFSVQARGKLASSRGLAEFAGRSRPLLLATVALFFGGLAVCLMVGQLTYGVDAFGPCAALGVLLWLARLLAAHGFAGATTKVLAAAAGAELLGLGSVFAGRLPGCAALGHPVESVVQAWGAGALPAAVCGVAAIALLARAAAVLARASAHCDDQ